MTRSVATAFGADLAAVESAEGGIAGDSVKAGYFEERIEVGNITFDNSDTICQTVSLGISLGKDGHPGVALYPDRRSAGKPPAEDQRNDAAACSQISDAGRGCGRCKIGEQQRIQGEAVAMQRLGNFQVETSSVIQRNLD